MTEDLLEHSDVLESMPDGIIVFDAGWIARHANTPAADLLGRTVDQIVGCDVESLTGAGSGDSILALRSLLGRPTERNSILVRWGSRILSTSVRRLRTGPSVREIGYVVAVRDTLSDLDARRAVTAILSITQHDLRSPLGNVLGYATQMLEREVFEPKWCWERAAGIVAAAQRMVEVIDNVASYAELQAEQVRVVFKPFVLAELVGNVYARMEAMARQKGLRLLTSVAEDVPDKLPGARPQLERILTNLVSNAIKFTDEGEVSVRVYLPDEDHWALAVTDTGVGIAEEALPHIFDPFRVGEYLYTREHQGAGLGLAIVEGLVSLMGGKVVVESELGKGSTFTVILPRSPARAESEPLAVVVDDHPDSAHIFAVALRKEGFRTLEFYVSRVALEYLDDPRTETPDLLVLDLQMPGTTGTQLLRHIRSQERYAETRIVLFTAYPAEAKGLQDADLTVTKPVSYKLLRRVSRWLLPGGLEREALREAVARASSEHWP